MACKTTIIFSTVLKDTVCNGRRMQKHFEKRFRKKLDSKFRIPQKKMVTASCTGWISNFERKPRTVRISLGQDRVVCYHVAKLHTTMWQSPIKVAGADHAVWLYHGGGVCKVVGTHRVLHLGSIERERVTREWASDVPCGYYGMIYLGGVYILRVRPYTWDIS